MSTRYLIRGKQVISFNHRDVLMYLYWFREYFWKFWFPVSASGSNWWTLFAKLHSMYPVFLDTNSYRHLASECFQTFHIHFCAKQTILLHTFFSYSFILRFPGRIFCFIITLTFAKKFQFLIDCLNFCLNLFQTFFQLKSSFIEIKTFKLKDWFWSVKLISTFLLTLYKNLIFYKSNAMKLNIAEH